MITELGQHPVILGKPWMRKHGVSYHGYNDTISFKTGFCTHIEAPGFPFPKQPQQLENEPPTLINEFKPTKILKRVESLTFNEPLTQYNERPRKFNEP